MSRLEVGSRVKYSAAFLRSVGIYTGALPFARGTIVDVVEYGHRINPWAIATIDWDGNHWQELPRNVNTRNLVGEKELELL